MSSLPIDTTNSLVIELNTSLTLENFNLEVLSYLGEFITDVYYFKVNILATGKLGLLRVGEIESGLSRELQLREILGDYKMVAELLACTIAESVIINLEPGKDKAKDKQPEEIENHQDNRELVVSESNYLEEEYYPEQEIISNSSTNKLILLTALPEEDQTLATWLKIEHSLEESLFMTGQVCQFLRYVHQRNWCFISIVPQLMQIGTPMQFFDLTSAYPVGEILPSGLLGDYCAPELAYGKNHIHESMGSYTVGALLYHAIHQQTLPQGQFIEVKIRPIPQIYQILKISLSPIPEERFALPQLLGILVETRQEVSTVKIQWNIASRSTVGLSTHRLHNEDNYGVRQQQLSDTETMIVGVIADGMGGMSQGELASKLAVQIVLEESISPNLKTPEQRNEWLIALFTKVNESVATYVQDGGTTLSVILAMAQQLMIAHVGDSRIYLLRQGEIRQLSEDHSLIAMLVASGQITLEESINHPDRNVLTKFLGAKQRLSDGYVQDLSRTNQELAMKLENEDILLLCSDGVWDLVRENELLEIFNPHEDLQLSVDKSIEKVLQRGASDNATLLALKCRVEKNIDSKFYLSELGL
ncbi:PP2C family protein-serine/threonine phosphatase [Umezakia ovalisporum]|uniref:Serine/threonine-protein phosphatase n=1 Tax=Umezakia ovalisporum FSS-43 TaxID=2740520 RepID=A0ABT6K484_9CYAN|nr:serine/threonine-protein phosphatase [Umezakia ovalisporum]MDH6057163.1 serine/threonine-protein phosphatase [Umezakia ovalisporum FSS-43]MDH6071703.1 serine/threonine-protein phosphatase [Umezakia ovalisporum CobakiLakeA]MDH6073409.1 serine/threonine-protein phosphatase [Umezakia ovalisporum CS-1034]MDH6080773.1 serine/threonine-protein phosphatase [Umezakia ovalisporum FSS-44]MDH6093945.1 serine/threonine-protein phosphatase [Umezakia ovalisporum CobakiLakeB]